MSLAVRRFGVVIKGFLPFVADRRSVAAGFTVASRLKYVMKVGCAAPPSVVAL